MSKKLYILFILLVCMNMVAWSQTTVTLFADSAMDKSRSLRAHANTGLTFLNDSILVSDQRGGSTTTNILEQGYCVFDLAAAGIPAGATITSVTLGYYIASVNTGSITNTNFYVNAVPGDVSSNTDENIMNGILKHDKLATSNTLHVNNTGFGSSVGNQTLSLDRSLSWLGAQAGGKVSLIFTERSLVSTATRRTAIMGYTGNSASTTAAYHRPYITVTYTAPSACSGAPSAGVAVATPQAGNAATYHVLSLSGASLSDGLTYQWQSSATETGSYIAISGATQRTYSFSSVATTRYFRCAISCGSSTTYSTPTPVFLINTYSCSFPVYSLYYYSNYAISTTYPMGGMTINTTITGDSGTVITDSMTASPRSYNNQCNAFGQQGLIFYKGRTHVLQVRSAQYNQNWQAWIDFNNNGSFEASELQGGAIVSSGSGAVSTVTLSAIPSTVPTGYYRMRVVSVYSSSLPISCPTAYTYGNTRDYLVKIGDGPTASATPDRLGFGYMSSGFVSPGLSTLVTASYLTPASGSLTIAAPTNFEVSPDSTTWSSAYTVSYTASSYTARIYVRFRPPSAVTYIDTARVTGGGLVSGLKIPLWGVGVFPCSGTPVAGTSTIRLISGGSSSTYELNLVGSSTVGGLAYQWQSSATGGAGTWTNMSGATVMSYTFTTGYATTYYRCLVTCTSSSSTDSSSVVVSTYALPASSCTPTTTNAAYSCTSYLMILSKLRLNGALGYGWLGDSAACSITGYNDRTVLRTTLYAGNSYTVNMTTGPSYAISTQFWIDFNSNGAFESSETVGGSSRAFVDTSSCRLSIPSTVNGGIYRMRVFTSYSPMYPAILPCGGHSYGGARDYTIVINACFRPSFLDFRYCMVDSLAIDSTATLELPRIMPDSGYIVLRASTGFGVSFTSGVYRTMDSIYYRGGTLPATRIYTYFLPRTVSLHRGSIRISGGSVDTNIQLTLVGRAVHSSCTGTASAGTISTSTFYADDTTLISMIGTGVDTSGGIEAQWQSSIDSITWVDIAGANTDTLAYRGIRQKTFFRRKVFCYFSRTSTYTNVVVVYYPHRIVTSSWVGTSVCNEYRLNVTINSSISGMRLVTNFGDGTTDTLGLDTTSNYSVIHAYTMSGGYTIRCKLYKLDTLYDSLMLSSYVSFCNTIRIRNFYDIDTNCSKSTIEDLCMFRSSVKVDSAGYTIDTIAYLGSLNYSAYGPIGTVYRFTPLLDTVFWRIPCISGGSFVDTLQASGFIPRINYVPVKQILALKDFGVTTRGGISRIANGRIFVYAHRLMGSDTLTANVKYRLSPRMRFYGSSPAPSAMSSDSLEYSWNFNRFRFQTIYLWVRQATGLFTLGDTFYTAAQIGPVSGDTIVANNNSNRCDTVVSSYDPNYIESDPAGCITSGITTEYTVGFENTGSDTAYNVHVLDTLSEHLDPRTLEPIMSSHHMVMETRHVAGRTIVKFDFPDIKLLDSSQHQGNHGMFKYKIRVRSGLADGTLISSRVGIYFDDNDVVMTNTQVNTINCPVYVSYPTVESVGGARVGGTVGADNLIGSTELKVYPNPVNDELHIEASLSQYDECVVTNTMGKIIWSSKLHLAHQMIATKQWPSGIYFVQIKGAMGSRTIKMMKQ